MRPKPSKAAPPKPMIYSCDYGPYSEHNPTAARASQAARSVTLAAGLPAAMIRVTGRGGAPAVTLTGPDGRRIAAPDRDGNVAGRDHIVLRDEDSATTLFALNRPAPGRWTVIEQPGSVAVAGVAGAAALPPAHVRGRVLGRGRSRTLAYRLRPGAGRQITFAEQGPSTYRVLGHATGVRGRIRFRPADGRGGRRTIVALVASDGVPTRTITLAHYVAPQPRRPSLPRRLRVMHRGATLTVTWARVPRARSYDIVVLLRNGRRLLARTSRPRARIKGVRAELRGRVLVAATSAAGLSGREARARVRPVSARRCGRRSRCR